MTTPNLPSRDLMGMIFRAHPWHGISIGEEAPEILNAYIETVPSDTVKYEMDKMTGILRADRPQKFSNICPTLYGFIPQTLCSTAVAELCMQRSGRTGIIGDEDPLDICVLTEKIIPHGDILMRAVPIGGIRMIDQGEADDKIIAIMNNDALYGRWKDIEDCPQSFLDRLKHYFLTYKSLPDQPNKCEIAYNYGKEDAYKVIEQAIRDYHSLLAKLK